MERDNKIFVCRLSVIQQSFANQKPTIPKMKTAAVSSGIRKARGTTIIDGNRRTSLVTQNKKKTTAQCAQFDTALQGLCI